MRETMATSWRRLSDLAQKRANSHGITGQSLESPRRAQAREAQALETWDSEGGPSALSTAPRRILIVDEDIKASDALERMLNASGYPDTRVAYSGHAALVIAAELNPSIVLLELSLMDMSGYEVARLLRGRAQSHDLRLIALTSSREHAGRELARASGFERYLLKPVAAADLSRLLSMDAGRRPGG